MKTKFHQAKEHTLLKYLHKYLEENTMFIKDGIFLANDIIDCPNVLIILGVLSMRSVLAASTCLMSRDQIVIG